MHQLGIPADEGVVRIGIAHYNTAGEIDETVESSPADRRHAAATALVQLSLLAAEPGQKRRQIVAERVAEIAAFLDDDGRQAEPGDRFGDAGKARRRDRQSAERIALEGVEAERNDQRVRREGLDAAERGVERFEESRRRRILRGSGRLRL